MRRHIRTVRRKRLVEILGDRDGVSAAAPGLVCGVLAIWGTLFAVEVGRARAPERSHASADVARASSAPVTSAAATSAAAASVTSDTEGGGR